MIKLTPEQIERILDENFGFANVKEAMLFMQDEVLRLNGVSAPQFGGNLMRGSIIPDDGKVCAIRTGEQPRATGCPDTMDDMGSFAEVEMPAFLRKQNPA